MIKKIVIEIIMMIIVWIVGSIYAYFNTSFGADVWWISAILVIVSFGLINLYECINKNRNKSK